MRRLASAVRRGGGAGRATSNASSSRPARTDGVRASCSLGYCAHSAVQRFCMAKFTQLPSVTSWQTEDYAAPVILPYFSKSIDNLPVMETNYFPERRQSTKLGRLFSQALPSFVAARGADRAQKSAGCFVSSHSVAMLACVEMARQARSLDRHRYLDVTAPRLCLHLLARGCRPRRARQSLLPHP